MTNNFGEVIWTNHALQRLKERNISQSDAYATFYHPSQSRYAQTKGAWVFYRDYGSDRIEVVASQNEKKEWVIMSVWSKPLYEKYQSFPRKKEYASFNFLENLVEKVLQLLFGKIQRKK